ncbi:MFS transporter [Paeniroseomonas aquatica]|uniref:MFS transporter n=1 Tax=Paeniroseomonas aquatica TaxID=373043 RepID=A0ABT8AEE8_9PROT|nr:MFS transporter [Paeniroseomonas aquatica]MDN3567841.1 MFS transporter [Paeniroseomonas aquatica]
MTASAAASPRLIDVPDFRRLWCVGLVVFLVRWLELLAVSLFVYQATGSAFLVTMMGMLRILPMGLFGALLGAVADRVEARTALLGIVLASLLTSLVLAGLAWGGMLAVWHLAVASFINGLGWAADNPVRRMMIGQVVGPARMGAAMSADVGSNNASRMLGPTLSGLIFATVGIEGAFVVSVLLYGLGMVAAWRLRYRSGVQPAGGEGVLARIAEGVAVVRRDPRLVGTLAVTVIFNIFGWPFTSLIPVVGQDHLLLAPQGIGLLASMDGVGAFAGALAMAAWAKPTNYARCYLGGVSIYFATQVAFALAPHPLLAGGALFFTGFGQAGFSIMQATLVYLLAPAEVRSRVLGLLSVCIGLGPIGFVHIGLLADALGAQWACVISGAEGLLAMLLTRRLWRPIQGATANE